MNLPNKEAFVSHFGGQVVSAVYASMRKSEKSRANGQTLRGLPNMVISTADGRKFTLQGIICALNGWDDVALSTSPDEGKEYNSYGVVPFNWRGEAGCDPRCDAMRNFMKEVVLAMDASLAAQFEEPAKVPAVKVSKKPSSAVLAELGL